jgi:hypothetical protein
VLEHARHVSVNLKKAVGRKEAQEDAKRERVGTDQPFTCQAIDVLAISRFLAPSCVLCGDSTAFSRVKTQADFGIAQQRRAVLRAEHDVEDDAGEGLRHGGILSRPVGALRLFSRRTQGGARASLALGWLVATLWAVARAERQLKER